MQLSRNSALGFGALVILLIVAVYLPATHGEFIWDDRFYLYDRAWLRQGDQWWQIVLHGFPEWRIYYRPLGVALFATQLRLSDSSPVAMHWVSLIIHLANTVLVGILARNIRAQGIDTKPSWPLVIAAMLLFGLHPALVEPVAWISSQYDLLATMFMLLGLITNLTTTSTLWRSAVVAVCFFLAACSKESALAFPLLILVVDRWSQNKVGVFGNYLTRRSWSSQLPVYAAILFAGIAYLVARAWGLGHAAIIDGMTSPFSVAQIHSICITYLAYWKTFVWPMTGLNPMHAMAPWRIGGSIVPDVAIEGLAVAIFALSAFLFVKRRPLGGLMLGLTAALVPVLHLLPVGFDESYYHERYATTGIAVACAFIPCVLGRALSWPSPNRMAMLTSAAIVTVWLLMAIVNIRITVPLWGDEVRLWKWTLRENPDYLIAKDALLSTYVERGDVNDARPLADDLFERGRSCTKCMLNVAFLALAEHDATRASTALDFARSSMDASTTNRSLQMGYILGVGNLRELQGNFQTAEEAYRDAISVDSGSPEARMNLALLQIKQGRYKEAVETEKAALALSAGEQRTVRARKFADALADAKAAPSRTP